MIKKLTFLSLFLAYITFAYAQTNQTHHIIVVDETGSMQGAHGSKNIWVEVKNAIKEYVNSVETGDRITIYTYATEVSSPRVFTINNINDREPICAFIDSLKADGKNTCTYKALNKILNEYNLSQKFKANLIYLYTDGLNNCSGYTMQEIADMFKAKRDDYDYLYYISLGYDIPDDVREVAQKDKNIIPQKVADPQNKNNIIPKSIHFSEDLLVFDFTASKEVIQIIPLKITGSIPAQAKLYCEFMGVDPELDGIELVTREFSIENGQMKIEMKVRENAYFDDEKEIKLRLSISDPNILLGSNTLIGKVIFPKREKVKITFK